MEHQLLYNWLAFSAIFNGVVAFVTGLVVYLKNRKNPINKTFAILCLFLASWSLGYFFPLVQYSEELSLLSFRLLMVGAIFTTVAHFHFICAMLGIVRKKWKAIFFGYLFNVVVLVFLPTKYFIPGVRPKFDFNYWADTGIMYDIWLIVWVAFVFYVIYLLATYSKKSIGIRRTQLRYILIGDVISFTFGATNFPLWYDININPYFSILVSIQIIFFAYIIIRYRFLDVQTGLLNALRKIISLFLAAGFALLVHYLIQPNWSEMTAIDALLSFGLAIITYIFLYRLSGSPTFYRLFRITSFEHFKETLEKFRNQGAFYPSLAALQQEITHVFQGQLRLSSAQILPLTEELEEQYPKLIKRFQHKHKPLVAEEVYQKQQSRSIHYPYFSELQQLGEVVFPLYRGDDLTGFLVLGHKPYRNPYSTEEIDALTTTAFDLSLSLSVLQYNEALQQEVERKTQKLRESNQKLRDLDKAKDAFLSIVSHELRTPITVIGRYVDLIEGGKLDERKEKKYIGGIADQTEDLSHMVNNVLDVSRLQANRMKFKMGNVKIKSLLKKLAEDYRIMCGKKRIKFVFENPDKLDLVLRSDPDKLKLVFNNLVSNAYKFTPNGGRITMRIKKSKKRGFVRFEVEDTGIGIAKDQQKIIFDRFRQAEVRFKRAQEGTGLGLSIVKGIVQKLGGKVWVESEEGRGAVFVFLLPIKQK